VEKLENCVVETAHTLSNFNRIQDFSLEETGLGR
jgi:hypothetical protein